MSKRSHKEPRKGGDSLEERFRGPHGWANWNAHKDGLPPRETARVAATTQVLPTWTEHALYSDSYIAGELELGPNRLLITIPGIHEEVGRPAMQLVLRWYDHLPDPDYSAAEWETDVSDYHGGDIGDEFASLLALSLGCRMRSGGVTRLFYVGHDPAGSPSETDHAPPVLIPPQGRAVLPRIAESRSLGGCEQLLRSYPDLSASQAVALVRAARQYADALWIADADPRVAWIKLVGALETAANHWDGGIDETPVERLRRHRPTVYDALDSCSDDAANAIADELAHTFNVVRKFKDFVLEFDSGPPQDRPTIGEFDWTDLEQALGVIYNWRSCDLHDGIPFPPPLCESPQSDGEGQLMEKFPAIAVAGGGGVWEAEELPMYLHLFAYIAGETLRGWWQSMASETTS